MSKGTVVHLTSIHPPSDPRIFQKECVTLSEAGYKVVLVVPADGNRIVEGVHIHGVTVPNSRIKRMLFAPFKILSAALSENADLYHFHDPELIPVGILLKLYRKQVIYDAHEDLAKDVYSKDYIPRPLKGITARLARIIEAVAARLLDAVIAATPKIAEQFTKGTTVTVQNFPILQAGATSVAPRCLERPPAVAFIGGATVIRGIRHMVEAMGLIPSHIPTRLLLAARFDPPELEAELKSLPGWNRVDSVGWQSPDGVTKLLAQARAGVVLYHPFPNHFEAQPHKLFEYMSHGLPIIASDFPLWRKLIQNGGAGIVVDPLNPKAIADAICWIVQHPEEAEEMGRRGKEAAMTRFNWNNESKALLKTYEVLLRSGRNSSRVRNEALVKLLD